MKKSVIIIVFLVILALILILLFSGGYFSEEDLGEHIIDCGDGTIFGDCSTNKPYFCEEGTLVAQASTCGCPEGLTLDGESELIYFHPVKGKPWSVIVTVPSRFIQQQAVNIALPLLGIIIILVFIAVIIFRYSRWFSLLV